MDRRAFIGLAASGLLAATVAADAQEGRGTLPRVASLESTGSAIGVEAIKRVLTGQKQWRLYWDRGVGRPRRAGKPSDRSGSLTLEFMRLGQRFVARADNDDVHHAECEFEVTVKDDGFIFEGCWGTEKTMTYDPDDREYPFKGRYDGTSLWLAPSE